MAAGVLTEPGVDFLVGGAPTLTLLTWLRSLVVPILLGPEVLIVAVPGECPAGDGDCSPAVPALLAEEAS